MPDPVLFEGLSPDEVHKLSALVHPNPHHVLGIHPVAQGVVVRALRPGARSVRVRPDDPALPPREMQWLAEPGLWAAHYPEAAGVFPYRVETRTDYGLDTARDPYAFSPTLGEMDQHLASEGSHLRLYEKLGAHVRAQGSLPGVSFAVWAPNARRVSVVGDWNRWDGRHHPMRRLGATGIWELFVPELEPGARYKYEIVGADGGVRLKLDPFAFQAELRPETAGIIAAPSAMQWTDEPWLAARGAADPLRAPMSVYEVHLGSWMRGEDGKRWLTYRELAPKLAEYARAMGFTHVELLPVSEHPYDASWGYQVTGYFAPTSRFGTPDDFRHFVDTLHAHGLGVILDWVPAHFPRDAFALARFDGTALYEHADPRQGEHPDWGTLIFNLGRNEVRNFLLANALYWLDWFHIDGLRVDAVAAMLYLDYSRKAGEWVPNSFGGRENLEAVAFLRELNTVVHREYPGAMVIAEESTAWPAVSRPVYVGGLGFTFKWNMGWMHDTLAYFQRDPIYRRHHHNNLTFGLLYAWSENYMLPLSHDEVVHLKGSLLGKMPGDPWRRFANLRALFGYMWAHPGKKLLFMGGEFGQNREWNHDGELEWHLLDEAPHAGLKQLVADLNALYRAEPAMWEMDVEPQGFRWIDANDSDQSVASFIRWDRAAKRHVVCVLNATPVVRAAYRIGVPAKGRYREALNTDAAAYGGSNVGNYGGRDTEDVRCHGFDQSIQVTLPPLAVVFFVGEMPDPPPALAVGVETGAGDATRSAAAAAADAPGTTRAAAGGGAATLPATSSGATTEARAPGPAGGGDKT